MSTPVAEDLSLRVASELKAAMARRGLTGAKLAKELGVSAAWISYRLTGTQEIGLNDLARICAILRVNVLDVIGHAERGDGTYVSVGYDPSGEVDLISRIQRQVGHRSPLATTYPSGGRPPLTHPSGHGPPSGPRRTARTGR